MFDELKNAKAMLREIEDMYPNWRKFRDLTEAIRWHTTAQDKVINNLREENERLRWENYKEKWKSTPPIEGFK